MSKDLTMRVIMKVGAIAYRKTSKGIEICLVSSRRHRGKLTLPKGEVKPGETLAAAVKRELFEEAGLRGKVKQASRPLCFAAKSRDRDPVFYFLVKITDVKGKWPEKKVRQRVFTGLADMPALPLGDDLDVLNVFPSKDFGRCLRTCGSR